LGISNGEGKITRARLAQEQLGMAYPVLLYRPYQGLFYSLLAYNIFKSHTIMVKVRVTKIKYMEFSVSK